MTDLKDELAALRIERSARAPGGGVGWIKWAVLVAVLAIGGFAGWAWLLRERPAQVEVATITQRAAGTQASVLNASGYVTARRRATVSSKITGRLVEVNVNEGMAVREGQVLARLDDSSARAGWALAKAQLEAARSAVRETEVRLADARLTLDRQARLGAGGIAAQANLDQAKTEADALVARLAALQDQVKVASSQLALQQTDLDNTIIRAPFAGIAITRDAQAGEMVSPVSAGGGFTRTGISTIVDMKSLEIEVDVNESYINRVKPAQEVTAVLDAYPDFRIPAQVITTVPTADRQKATVLVRIGFKQLDPRILPNMGVKVTFLREAGGAEPASIQPVALVPKSAVKSEGKLSHVFVVRPDSTVERRAVRTGGSDGERLEVLAGLQPGERVVATPAPTLADGARVAAK